MNENMKKVLYVLVGILSLAIVALIVLKSNGNEKTKTYIVKFDSDGGTEVVSQKVIAGSIATKPDDPTKEGYTFDSWLYENEAYNFNASVNKDITLIAKWDEATNEEVFTVTFDTTGGTSIESVKVNKGDLASKPDIPTKEGYLFKYWSLNGSEYDFSNSVTSDITLVAVWEESAPTKDGYYQVIFDTAGGSTIESQEVKSGKKVSKPKNPTKSGYVFLDWYLNDKVYSFSTKVTSNITLTASWAKEGKYTITFDSDGGSKVNNQTVNAGKLVTKPTDPTKENYMFKEWQLDGVTYDFNTKVKEDMTLKAVWKTPEYTVTFDTDGGSTIKSQVIQINKTAKKPSNPTKTGYTFNGWYVGETEYKFTEKVTADITIKARWTANECTVTFNSDGGSNVASQTITCGTKVTKPTPNPTKEGYTFDKWQLNGNNYDFNTNVTSNITLKAIWTKNEVSKTYTFKVTNVDNVSTDRRIDIYENNTKITVSKIMYTNGTLLCNGSNPVVSWSDINGITTLKVKLTTNETVTATLSS